MREIKPVNLFFVAEASKVQAQVLNFYDSFTLNYTDARYSSVKLSTIAHCSGLPRLDQLVFFSRSAAYCSKPIQDLLFGHCLDKAEFIYYHALEYNWQFVYHLRYLFNNFGYKELLANMETNIMKIAKKIEDAEDEEIDCNRFQEIFKNNPFRLTDMLKAEIVLKIPE